MCSTVNFAYKKWMTLFNLDNITKHPKRMLQYKKPQAERPRRLNPPITKDQDFKLGRYSPYNKAHKENLHSLEILAGIYHFISYRHCTSNSACEGVE